jgi:hypothetical protein
LVPLAEAETAQGSILQTGAPFVPTPGAHDLDLVRDVLAAGEAVVIPDTGETNSLLITDGTVTVGLPGQPGPTLLAGEAAAFAGEIEVIATGDAPSAFVVAMIGATLPDAGAPPPATPPPDGQPTAAPTTAPPPTVGPEPPPTLAPQPTPGVTSGVGTTTAATAGSITVEVLNCPPGMQPATLDTAACQPAGDDLDFILSGDALGSTFTLADAAQLDGGYAWRDLPFGQYTLVEAVLPVGFDTYAAIVPAGVTGSPATGLLITLDETTPDVRLTVYNFAAA